MNCGSATTMNTIVFGFVKPTITPSRKARAGPMCDTDSASAPVTRRRWRMACAPRYTRYAAPASLTTVKTAAERSTSTPTPNATATTCR